MALNRTGLKIDPIRLPSDPTEPEKTMEKDSDKTRDLQISPDIILDKIRKRTAKRPTNMGKVAEEAFEVTEYAVVCTPIY